MAVSRRGPGDQLRDYVQYQRHVLFGSLPAGFRRHKRRMVESFVSVSRTFPFGQVFTRNGKTYTGPLVVYPCVRQSSRAFRWRFVGPESLGCFVESRRRTSTGESAFFSRDCPSPHSWRRWRSFGPDHRIQLICRSRRLPRRERWFTRAEGTGKSPLGEKRARRYCHKSNACAVKRPRTAHAYSSEVIFSSPTRLWRVLSSYRDRPGAERCGNSTFAP